jgi:hypothetical protein
MNKYQESKRILKQLKRSIQNLIEIEVVLNELYEDLKEDVASFVEVSKKMKNSENPSLFEKELDICRESIKNTNRIIRINKRYMETMRMFIEAFKHMNPIGA